MMSPLVLLQLLSHELKACLMRVEFPFMLLVYADDLLIQQYVPAYGL